MERKIGETFEFDDKKIEVKAASNGCDGCFLKEKDCIESAELVGTCGARDRTDNKNVVFVEVQEQPQEQAEQQQGQIEPQKLNLCEILKYCPQGETFWSPLLGDVKLYYTDQDAEKIVVTAVSNVNWSINADGTIPIESFTSPEIMLYPSREQRDWTKVKYEKKLPKTWKKFCKNYPRKKDEAYFDMSSQICILSQDYEYRNEDRDKNIMPSKQAAEAHLALMQLHQLRDAWREGWLPDWKDDNQKKYVIYNPEGEFTIGYFTITRRFLAFQDEKRADEFKNCFIDLIRKAGDLI